MTGAAAASRSSQSHSWCWTLSCPHQGLLCSHDHYHLQETTSSLVPWGSGEGGDTEDSSRPLRKMLVPLSQQPMGGAGPRSSFQGLTQKTSLG